MIILLVTVLILSSTDLFAVSVRATTTGSSWEMDRPTDTIRFNSTQFNTDPPERVENAEADSEASVGIGVDISDYDEQRGADPFNGKDGLTLKIAATANTRKGVTYICIDDPYDVDWIWPDDPTNIDEDNEGRWFNLEFDYGFRFYGGYGDQQDSATYTKVWVCSNGFLCFDNSNSTAPSPGGRFPGTQKPNAVIGVYWADLDPSAGGDTTYYSDSDKFVVCWHNVPNKYNNNYPETFEVILKKDRYPTRRGQNKIVFIYKNVSSTAYTAGIEDQQGYKFVAPRKVASRYTNYFDARREAGEIREIDIIAEKQDSNAKITIGDGYYELRGHNMDWKEPEEDPADLYEYAFQGYLTLLIGELGGLIWETTLVTLDCVLYAAKLTWPANYLHRQDAGTSQNLAYVKASAAYGGAGDTGYPVDASFHDQIYWIFMDSGGKGHSITITAVLKYYSYIYGEIKTIKTSVDVSMPPDIGDGFDTAKQVGEGEHRGCLDTLDCADMYQISVDSPYSIYLTMWPAPDANYDLYLYNPYHEQVASSKKSGNSVESIAHYVDSLSSGWWYIKVKNQPWMDHQMRGIYKLKIEVVLSGCPFVYVWNGQEYVVDNNILAASEVSNDTDVEDHYKLEQMLAPVYEGSKFSVHSLLISEFENEHSYIDQVKLMAVDHSSDVNIALTPDGEILTYKDPYSPVSCVDNDGNDMLDLITAIDDSYYQGRPDDYLLLDFGDLDVQDGAKLVLRADFPELEKTPCIHIQIQDHTGAWMDIAAVRPRVYWATEFIDLSGHLPDPEGNLKVRLYFTSNHKLDYAGLDTTPEADTTTRHGLLVSAVHSEEGPVTFKLLFNDEIYTELLPDQQITLTFMLRNCAQDARTFIIYTNGRYHTITP